MPWIRSPGTEGFVGLCVLNTGRRRPSSRPAGSTQGPAPGPVPTRERHLVGASIAACKEGTRVSLIPPFQDLGKCSQKLNAGQLQLGCQPDISSHLSLDLNRANVFCCFRFLFIEQQLPYFQQGLFNDQFCILHAFVKNKVIHSR